MMLKTNNTKSTFTFRLLAIITLAVTISACGGSKTFNDYARAGDTVAVVGGFQKNFNLSNISVQVKKKGPGGPIAADYPVGDLAIRGSVNFYQDPLSSMVVSRETGVEQTEFADTYESTIDSNYTFGDKDWYTTTVFVDLPTSNLTVGDTYRVIVTNQLAETFESDVLIIAGVGSPSTLSATGQDLEPKHIAASSRVPHYEVIFDGATVPHAIELILNHDPDITTGAGGTGKALAINPTGFKKNLSWTDDGTQMKVILTSTSNINIPDNILDYKFYIAGGLTNVAVDIASVLAYDVNGDTVAGVTATTTFAN